MTQHPVPLFSDCTQKSVQEFEESFCCTISDLNCAKWNNKCFCRQDLTAHENQVLRLYAFIVSNVKLSLWGPLGFGTNAENY